jgi:hypothetical protein
MEAGFGSTHSDPVYHYHSVFDSERWQEVYGDPGFVKHVSLTSQRVNVAHLVISGRHCEKLGFTDSPSCRCIGTTFQYDTLRLRIRELP